MEDKWQNAFRKRHRTMFKKAHLLKSQAPENIRIYMLIERLDDESLYYWNSNPEDGDWPLSVNDVENRNAKIMHAANTNPTTRRKKQRKPATNPQDIANAGLETSGLTVKMTDGPSNHARTQDLIGEPSRTTTTESTSDDDLLLASEDDADDSLTKIRNGPCFSLEADDEPWKHITRLTMIDSKDEDNDVDSEPVFGSDSSDINYFANLFSMDDPDHWTKESVREVLMAEEESATLPAEQERESNAVLTAATPRALNGSWTLLAQEQADTGSMSSSNRSGTPALGAFTSNLVGSAPMASGLLSMPSSSTFSTPNCNDAQITPTPSRLDTTVVVGVKREALSPASTLDYHLPMLSDVYRGRSSALRVSDSRNGSPAVCNVLLNTLGTRSINWVRKWKPQAVYLAKTGQANYSRRGHLYNFSLMCSIHMSNMSTMDDHLHYQLLHQKRMMQAMRRKRRVTLFNKAHEFATKCNAHVYLLVRYGQRYYSYTSLDHPSWPPTPQDVIHSYPLPHLMDAKTFVPKANLSSSPSSDDLDEEQPLLQSDACGNKVASSRNKPLPTLRRDDDEGPHGAASCNTRRANRDEHRDISIKSRTSELALSTLYEVSDEGEEIPCIYIPS